MNTDSENFYFFIAGVTWQNQECRLTLHFENGFTLTEAKTIEDGRRPTVLWHHPFEKLRMSADDSVRLFWLDFGDEGEQVNITEQNNNEKL